MLEAGDAEFVESLYANAQVTRTLLRIQRPRSTEEARKFCKVPAAACGHHRFVAALQADGRLIALGSVATHLEVPSVASIGYSVLPAYRRQGLGTELAGLLVRFAVVALGALEVRATTLHDNLASARLLEKLGFTALEAGASQVDSRGDGRRVTRWVLSRAARRSRHGPPNKRLERTSSTPAAQPDR